MYTAKLRNNGLESPSCKRPSGGDHYKTNPTGVHSVHHDTKGLLYTYWTLAASVKSFIELSVNTNHDVNVADECEICIKCA
jgi:hypothetical protein